MYRPLSKPPTGAWARHLQKQREERDLSQTQAFELVHERIGWSRHSRTAYTAIDNGDRQPKDIEVTVLGAEFGWPSGEDADPEVTDQAALVDALAAHVAAMAAQTEAINRMIDRLDSLASKAIRDEVRELGPAFGASPNGLPPGPQP